jgi:hypothetical protein
VVGTASATNAGNGWWRVSVSGTSGTTASVLCIVASNSFSSFTGTTGYGVYAWGAQLNTGSSAGTYQRIAAATDYATAGFLPYLALDGTDDSMATGSIDFSATDKMAVFAGVTKLSDATQAVIAELSATIASNNSAFLLTGPNTATVANFNYRSKGTTPVDNIVVTYAAPYTAVLTAISNISGSTSSIRVNNGTFSTVTSSQGTGNYGNYPLYIGRRGGATLPFNGRIYQMVVCGKTLSADELASTEAYVNTKTGAY